MGDRAGAHAPHRRRIAPRRAFARSGRKRGDVSDYLPCMTVAPPRHATTIDSLNPAQREAVLHSAGPLLVLAGAGSGKTRVLTARIANLIQQHGVSSREILAVTFTNKAAGEMRDRIGRLLGDEPVGMWCGTFHAIGARMIRAHAPLVGRTASF